MAAGLNTHILSVLVQNKRVSGAHRWLIPDGATTSSRSAVGPTESPEMSRITLQVSVEDVFSSRSPSSSTS